MCLLLTSVLVVTALLSIEKLLGVKAGWRLVQAARSPGAAHYLMRLALHAPYSCGSSRRVQAAPGGFWSEGKRAVVLAYC
jgi:hypothetical protein